MPVPINWQPLSKTPTGCYWLTGDKSPRRYVPLEEVAKLGYNVFYHGQKGHYGVALLTKETPIAVRRGFPGDDEEAQRRIIMAEIPSLWAASL